MNDQDDVNRPEDGNSDFPPANGETDGEGAAAPAGHDEWGAPSAGVGDATGTPGADSLGDAGADIEPSASSDLGH